MPRIRTETAVSLADADTEGGQSFELRLFSTNHPDVRANAADPSNPTIRERVFVRAMVIVVDDTGQKSAEALPFRPLTLSGLTSAQVGQLLTLVATIVDAQRAAASLD